MDEDSPSPAYKEMSGPGQEMRPLCGKRMLVTSPHLIRLHPGHEGALEAVHPRKEFVRGEMGKTGPDEHTHIHLSACTSASFHASLPPSHSLHSALQSRGQQPGFSPSSNLSKVQPALLAPLLSPALNSHSEPLAPCGSHAGSVSPPPEPLLPTPSSTCPAQPLPPNPAGWVTPQP